MDNNQLWQFIKYGGAFTIVGIVLFAILFHPKCDLITPDPSGGRGGVYKCHSFAGEDNVVVIDQGPLGPEPVPQPPFGQTGMVLGAGAIVGALIGLLAGGAARKAVGGGEE